PNHPKGTQLLRRDLQDQHVVPEKEEVQDSYSHFIDAQMAFLLAAEDHKNDGSMGLRFDEQETVWPVSHQTGEEGSTHAYESVRIAPEGVVEVELARTPTYEKINQLILTGRPLHAGSIRQLFKDNPVRLEFKPIFKIGDKWHVGYPKPASGRRWDFRYVEKKTIPESDALEAIELGYYLRKRSEAGIELYVPNSKAIYKDIANLCHVDTYTKHDRKKRDGLEKVWKWKVYLQKTLLKLTPNVMKNENARKHPSIERWERFDSYWQERAGNAYKIEKNRDGKLEYHIDENLDKQWVQCCKEFLGINRDNSSFTKSKVRKTFSMGAVTNPSGTALIIRGKGNDTFHIVLVDNLELPRDLIPFLIRKSKNVFSLDKTFLESEPEPYHPISTDGEKKCEAFFTKEAIENI
ncbi:MAG: hypothetical protein D6732_29265, partial [Methanobacteriota archaeon]